jgi:hypothetical protein
VAEFDELADEHPALIMPTASIAAMTLNLAFVAPAL